MSLSYPEAVSLHFSLADFERKSRANEPPDFHLLRIERLLEYIGNPHREQNYVHVAGSKGKGSTSALISWGLTGCGYKTGFFSSPSIHKVTERFRVNGKPISESEFVELVESIWPAVQQVKDDGDIGIVSVFEMQTAMAFQHFNKVGADVSVIEVGLGGRLDSTNVLDPLVSIITPISLDHVGVLGNTIPEIASEKAGIIKAGKPVVSAGQIDEAFEVIQSTALERASKFTYAPGSWKIEVESDLGLDGKDLIARNPTNEVQFHLNLLGEHQVQNAQTAITVLSELNSAGFKVNLSKAVSGFEKVDWPARNQVASTSHPIVFVDGAHNGASAKALRESVIELFPRRSGLILIFGAIRGHDPTEVILELESLNPQIVVTESRHPKSLSSTELANKLAECKINPIELTTNTSDALVAARKLADPSDIIVGAGSLFVAAEIVEIEQGIEPELYPDL